ncbi:MAG TPA: mucoidy inhibitor MuiA family protein, partial [Myxococcaceae bacterium]|nr:mucoidy inhibitor MuiA family protein [Myxococcaceae bacterium]
MNPVSVDSVLDAVTVYAEGAICRRRAKVSVQKGEAWQLRLPGLPLSLVEGTLRASVVSGPAELRVRDVRPGFDVLLPEEADLPEEGKALERAEDQVRQLELERNRVGREITDVAALKPVLPDREKGGPPREAVLEAGLALAGFVDDRLKELYLRQQQLTEALEEANAQVALHRRRLQSGSSAVRRERARLTRTAVVTLSVPGGSGEAELSLEYLVPGATWSPTYDLRLDRAMEKGALMMRANVAQRTGEDWSGVKLSLSTAKLDRRIEVPELSSLRIGKSQPPAP